MLLPDLVADPEGVERPEGVLPRREREPRRPQRRRRLQHQAPHPFPGQVTGAAQVKFAAEQHQLLEPGSVGMN